MENALVVADEKKLERFKRAAVLAATDIQDLVVNSLPTYKICLAKMDEAQAFQREIKTFFKPMRDAAFATHKEICNKEAMILLPHKENESIAKRKAGRWYQEEQRKAEEKTRKERERLEVEAARKRAEEAEKLINEGKKEEAEEVIAQPIVVREPETKSRASGMGFQMIDNWKAVVIDIDQLDRKYMIPDMELLTKLAKANKGKNPPEGVLFVNEQYSKRSR